MKRNIRLVLLSVLFALLLAALAVPFATNAEGTTYELTVQIVDDSGAPFDGAEVTVLADGIAVEGVNGVYTVPAGSRIRLNARLKNLVFGYGFKEWQTPTGTYENTTEVEPFLAIDGDNTVKAVFAPLRFNIYYVKTNPNQYGFDYDVINYPTPTGAPTEHVYGTDTALPTPILQSPAPYTFLRWKIYKAPGEELLPAGRTVIRGDDITTSGTSIYLVPVWEPNAFSVTRYDRLGTPDAYTDLGQVSGEAPFGSTVSGLDFGSDPDYTGYVFRGTDYTQTTVKTVVNGDTNEIYRYYEPRRYNVEYYDVDAGWTGPATHTYGTATELGVPTREGYTFLGWEIYANASLWTGNIAYDSGTGVWTIPADAYSYADESVPIAIRATWQEKRYAVTYDPESVAGNDTSDTARFPDDCGYTEDFLLTEKLTRTGYTFLGWRIKGSSDEFTKNFRIQKNTRVDDVVLEAGWQANTYTATFDPTEGANGTESATVTFDAALPAIEVPTREGWDFAGYFIGDEQYYNADGTPVAGRTWKIAGDATLTAKWTIRTHTVTVNVTDGTADRAADVEIKVNTLDYTGPVPYDYGTTIVVTVTVKTGVDGKFVLWNGEAVAHARTHTETFVLGDADAVVTVRLLPTETTPAFTVNYREETLEGLTPGDYRVETEGAAWSFRVGADGSVTSFESARPDPARVSDLFGKTLSIVRLGDGDHSDSDPQQIRLAARPAAPTEAGNGVVLSSDPLNSTVLKVRVNDPAGAGVRYEVAITRGASEVPSVWYPCLTDDTVMQTPLPQEYLFTGLNAGTPYFVHVRVVATSTNPHGEAFIAQGTTSRDSYFGEWKDKLYRDFAEYRGGENVERLLDRAAEEGERCDASATYESDLQDIYDRVAARVGFEKSRDDAIAELRAYRASLDATKAYDKKGSNELEATLEAAVAAINSEAVISEVDVQRLSFAARNDMDAVRVNYLSSVTDRSEILLYARLGLPKGTAFTAAPTDAATVRAQLRAALRRGTVVLAAGNTEATDARAVLSGKDAVAAYRMFCSSEPAEGDLLEFRLLLPENLRSESEFSVAYYDNRTETVVLLASKREGNELVFLAPSVADFVVFSEHVTQTAPILVILSVILVLQIAAIALLLVGRSRARQNAVALPLLAALALRVSPAGSMPAVWVLLALVAVLGVVLICLILSTGLVWRRRELPDTEAEDELNPEPPEGPVPTLLDETVDTAAPDGPPLDTPTEEELPAGEAVAAGTLDPDPAESENGDGTANAVDWTGARPAAAEKPSEAVPAFAQQPEEKPEEKPVEVPAPTEKPEVRPEAKPEVKPEVQPEADPQPEAPQTETPQAEPTKPEGKPTERPADRPDPDNPFAAEADALWGNTAPKAKNVDLRFD